MVVGGVQTRSKRRGPPARGGVKGKKLKVVRRQSDGSDDDFVAPPLAFLARLQEDPVWNAPDGVLTAEEDVAFPKIKTRSPACVLVDSLKDLSCQQKNDIRDMGFAALLDFNVGGCPPRLVHWLLSNFDGESRVFDLGGGRSLALEERDVEFVLGFPRGPVEMVKRDKLDISNLLTHWRGKFEKKRHEITAAGISTVMVSRVNGGLWFRRHFCMLVLSTLVSCMCNGYANQMYFHHFDDVARIRDLNWCKLVVDALVETQAAWKSSKHKIFVGPAEFVALFYVDRVIHFARPIPRLFPAFRGWSKELLNQREFSEIRFGGFGRGVIELPEYDVVHADGVGNPTQGHGEDGGGCSSPVTVCLYGPKTFAEVVAEATAVAARSIRELLRLVKNASDGVFDGEVCGQLCEAIQVLVGLKQRVNCTISAGSQPSQSTFSQREDIFWSKEANIRAIEDIERAIMERNEFMDMPSFSLGLTQDFNDAVRAGGGDNEPVCGLARSGRSNGLGLAADLVNGVGGACASPSPLQGADVNFFNPAVGSPDVGPANIGVGNLCCSGDMAAPPAAGGAEIVGQVSGTEVELEGTAVAPDEVTPFVEPADQVIGDDRCRSDGAVCGAPLKTVRAARPPPDAIRGIGPLGEKSDGTSDLAVGSLPDSPDEAVIVNWLLAGGADNMEEVVFCIGSRLARWDDLLTLVPGSEVGVAVIDAWASLLNQREPRYDWARSARTDKGVSAVGQVVSGRFYIDPPGLVDRLNSNLAPQIRIFGYKRATASFNAKKFCDRRRYVYLIPVFALDPSAHRDRESVLASLGSGNELVKCLECSERGRKVIGIMGKRTFDSKNELSVVSSGSGISSNTGDSQNQQENMNNSIHSGSGILSNTGDSQNQQENMNNSIDDESKPNSEIEKKAGNETSQDEINEVTNMEVEEGNEEAIVPKKIFSYGDEEKDRFNRILKYYEGTHNFHNFTTRTKAEDPAAKRYIISFTANTVVEVEGIDFVKCEVVGQSFMLHQIRKMIGLALAIMRNCAPESLIETAFSKDVNINVPMAPEVGLYLDECFFSSYNKRWTDHEELSMKAYADVAEDFKMKYIYSHIASTEHKEGVMGLWLHSLNYRNYPDLRFSNCDETTDAKSVEAANIPDSCTVNNGEALDAKTVEGAVVADSCAVKNNESASAIESNDTSRSCAMSEADACPGKNDEPANAKTTESNDMAPSSAMSEADAKTVEAADNVDSCPGKNDESATAKTTFEADAPDAKTVEADSCPGKNNETATAKTTFEADAPDAKTVEAAENTDSCPGKNDESASAKATESNAMADVKSIADEDMAE